MVYHGLCFMKGVRYLNQLLIAYKSFLDKNYFNTYYLRIINILNHGVSNNEKLEKHI